MREESSEVAREDGTLKFTIHVPFAVTILVRDGHLVYGWRIGLSEELGAGGTVTWTLGRRMSGLLGKHGRDHGRSSCLL